jgi:hypothetical protein
MQGMRQGPQRSLQDWQQKRRACDAARPLLRIHPASAWTLITAAP